jgi:hypothetical protein
MFIRVLNQTNQRKKRQKKKKREREEKEKEEKKKKKKKKKRRAPFFGPSLTPEALLRSFSRLPLIVLEYKQYTKKKNTRRMIQKWSEMVGK